MATATARHRMMITMAAATGMMAIAGGIAHPLGF